MSLDTAKNRTAKASQTPMLRVGDFLFRITEEEKRRKAILALEDGQQVVMRRREELKTGKVIVI
jgi:hypothetical protein